MPTKAEHTRVAQMRVPELVGYACTRGGGLGVRSRGVCMIMEGGGNCAPRSEWAGAARGKKVEPGHATALFSLPTCLPPPSQRHVVNPGATPWAATLRRRLGGTSWGQVLELMQSEALTWKASPKW